jgi:hypothetical protein
MCDNIIGPTKSDIRKDGLWDSVILAQGPGQNVSETGAIPEQSWEKLEKAEIERNNRR